MPSAGCRWHGEAFALAVALAPTAGVPPPTISEKHGQSSLVSAIDEETHCRRCRELHDIAARMTPRYPPWLQKTLRVKEQSERFWTQQQLHLPSSATPHVFAGDSSAQLSKRTLSMTPHANMWAAVATVDALAVKEFAGRNPQCALARRETMRAEGDGCGSDGTTLLHEAAARGDPKIVAILLDALRTRSALETMRSVVNSVDTHCSRTTPLIAACRSSEVGSIRMVGAKLQVWKC